MKPALGKWFRGLVLLSLFFVAFLPGCVPSNSATTPSFPTASPSVTLPLETDLKFETVSIHRSFSNPKYSLAPEIKVLISKPVTLVEGITSESYADILNVDFSKYFVLLLFHGETWPGEGIEIKGIWQDKESIYVLAQFQPPQATTTVVPIQVNPYHIVKVSRESLIQFGEISFKLLDQLGQERAKATTQL